MAEPMTTMDRLELLEGKVAGILSRLPDPRMNTPQDHQEEMRQKMFANLTLRVQALETIYGDAHEGMKALQDQVDNLATAIRQLGSRPGPEFNGLANEFEEDLVEGRAEPQKPVPMVFIQDTTHGQHPRKVVVYLE